VNTLAQWVILARGRHNRGCRICGQKPELDDPPLMDAERAFHNAGHHFAPLSASTAQALMVDAFEVSLPLRDP
jgi:hypothetical protein